MVFNAAPLGTILHLYLSIVLSNRRRIAPAHTDFIVYNDYKPGAGRSGKLRVTVRTILHDQAQPIINDVSRI